MSSSKIISISLSPNTEKDDVSLAFKLLFQPWRWFSEKYSKRIEEKIKDYFKVEYAFSFNSGRSALAAILEALEIKEGDEVILQAFTCSAAVNPITARKAKPVFVDVDDTLNLDPEDLRRKISQKTKAIMVQHTFGWPANMEEILNIARENNIYLIEDCAHALGAKYRREFCGTLGDAAFFSFGRDKIISSVFGGVAVTDKEKIGEGIKKFQKGLNYPSFGWTLQQLLHPILMNWKIIPAYSISPVLGRILIGFFHKINILSKSVYRKEKEGRMAKQFPKRFPGALAILAEKQFNKLERFNNHRRETANLYKKRLKGFNMPFDKVCDGEPVFLRYPILIDIDTDEVLKEARKKRIFLDDGWRKIPIVPLGNDIPKMGYVYGSCPRAERVAMEILNLPTQINISEKEAERIIGFLKEYGSQGN
jgi:dTDP-4-amino-4,6-dideoxygalactose transaminase